MKFISKFKIKVGIEEFEVRQDDIERITRAMQTNEIVKLECGIIRGQAILAILEEKIPVAEDKDLTFEERKNKELLEARKNCGVCEGSGILKTEIDGKQKIYECRCQTEILKKYPELQSRNTRGEIKDIKNIIEKYTLK